MPDGACGNSLMRFSRGPTILVLYGTSCGIITLKACGEPHDSPDIEHLRIWLVDHQQSEGGWTSSTFQSKNILTTATCFVLDALHEAGDSLSSPVVQAGFNWLQRTQNLDHGWGYYEKDASSKITATAHAVLSFSHYPEMLHCHSASVGAEWLLNSRNFLSGCSGHAADLKSFTKPGFTAFTLLSLLAAGYSSSSTDTRVALRWLLLNPRPNTLETEVEAFYVQHPDGTGPGCTFICRHSPWP